MIFSGAFAISATTLVRLSSQEIHPFEIAFFRTFLIIPLFFPFFLKNGVKDLKTKQPKLTILRSCLGSFAMLLFFYGISLTELAKTQALSFTIPIFATLLAIFILGERVGIRRWTALLVGFFGALIVLRPDIEVSIGPILILFSCFFWSLSILIAKKLTKTDTNFSITLWQAIGVMPAAFFASLLVWKWPNFEQFSILLLIALFGTLAQFTFNYAIKRGDVSFILPMDYLKLIWATLLGFFIFGEIPNYNVWIGGTLIIMATIYISLREIKILKN